MYKIDEQYVAMLQNLMLIGKDTSPRGLATHEIIGYSSVIDMNEPILGLIKRKLNYKFMCAEAAWILAGQRDVYTIGHYCKNIAKFSDGGIFFYGAYGPKFYQQKQYVVDALKKDPSTRQAVINIWREKPPPTKDVPCTLSWQFLIRDRHLDMIATMRSSDAWLGWPYDVFNQCMTAAWVALETDRSLELGKLLLNCGSQHLYERDADLAQHVVRNRDTHDIKPFNVTEFESGKHLIDTLWEKANGKLPIFDV